MSSKKDVAIADEAQTQDAFSNMVERLAANPDIDADKIDKFLSMQERILDRQAKTEFYDAMNRVQAKLPSVLPNRRNEQTHSDYADLKAVSDAIKPVYTTEGFSTSFWQGDGPEGLIRVCGILRHRSGFAEPERHVDLPPDRVGIKGSVNKTDIHAAGSAFTYGRRYLTCLMFDLAVGEDIDGNPSGPVETINDDQQIVINDLLDETGADRDLFLKWCKAESVEAIPASKYKACVARLEEKRAGS